MAASQDESDDVSQGKCEQLFGQCEGLDSEVEMELHSGEVQVKVHSEDVAKCGEVLGVG
eukprot:CAMPEP_0203881980 /NCGR_PEP_ID=MMETSP0359-20131031/26233_1 /ASSEMBLY_ACC=CAM_ASM_000338 /TAXON_ID=268821 /ORGANISM="Scrippsiella Hangoei, Strain SHTV-5" /LENGTH=58 /DNA_ID=CAMNT_0050801929 /DNA_START=8 /DNA_END=180 /DNA_ORIENTATION=-